jgi:hypothetical protein
MGLDHHEGRSIMPLIARRLAIGCFSVAVVAIASLPMVSSAAARGGRVVTASARLEGSAHSSAPLTKAQFITKANALCAAAASQLAVALQPYAGIKSNPTPQEIAGFIKAYSSAVQTQINKTKALKPPKHDAAKITAILKADQGALNALKANPALLGGRSPFLAADSLARKYGLKDAPGAGSCQRPSG